jgi:hypothetical protein
MYVSTGLAWAAGFFDGEGCIARGLTPVVTVSQTQLECLDVFANILGIGTLKGPYDKSTAKMTRKPQWIFYAYGGDAWAIYSLLRPWLSGYRHEQATNAFQLPRDAADDPDFAGFPLPERLAWAGGFFDGEGCFSRCGDGLNARITHTDPVLLDQFRSTVTIGKIYGPYAPHKTSFGKKPQYVFTVSGFERVQALLAMLWPNLGSAKRTKAMSLLDHHLTYWKCGHRRGPTWKMHCPICFKPGPKPGSRQAKATDTSLPGL